MEIHRNAEKVIEYLREHQTATISQIVEADVIRRRDASGAVQYGIRHGAIDRIKMLGARPGERVQYRLSGQPLCSKRAQASAPSFDPLLAAWGITPVPPQWSWHGRKRIILRE